MTLATGIGGNVVRALRMTAAGWVSLGAALCATWPLAAHLTTKVPLGTEHEATVPVFSLWNLWWTADRIPHVFNSFLDAPFFYPNRGVTTYSEPMPLLGAFVSPLWAAGARPALIYNVALLLVLTLNGVFAYRVARALRTSAGPALVASAIAVTLPFMADLMGVLPNLALFGMLWALDGLIRFGRTRWAGWAVWAAAGFIATFLTFQQYALFFAPVAVAGGLVALSEQRFGRPAVARLGAVGLLTVLTVLAIALPTIQLHRDIGGFERPPQLVTALSARSGDFITRPVTAVVPFPRRSAADTAGLFPGIVLSALALAGALMGLRDPARRRWTALLTATALFGFLLALGLHLDLAGWRPFGTLRSHVPGFDEVRSPYRAAALFQMCLPILAILALVPGGGRLKRGGLTLVVVVGLFAAAENLSVPQPLVTVPASTRTAWSSWLRGQSDRKVVAYVPFPAGLNVADYEMEAWRMFRQIDDRKPMVNGYSGFFPITRGPDGRPIPSYTVFQLSMAQEFPTHRLFCVLSSSLGANTLVIDRVWLDTHPRRPPVFRKFLRPVYVDRDVTIYALATPPGECRVA